MINYGGDFEAKKEVQVEKIPAGAYIGKVINAYVEDKVYQDRHVQRLVLELDVSEGDYAGFYSKQYAALKDGNSSYPVKYKGVYRANIPVVGDQYEGIAKRVLEGVAYSFEQSNSGYHWDWDESKLIGKAIGFSVREADYLIEQNGQVLSGTTTEIYKLCTVDDVRNGKVKMPKKRELKDEQKKKLSESQQQIEQYDGDKIQVDVEDLPF